MSTQLHTDISAETVRRIADERDEPAWLRETRLDALEALDDLAFPSVIETPGRKWTTLEDLDFDALVDPLSQTEDKDQVGAENARVESFHDALQDDDLADRVEDAFGSVIDPTRTA